MQRLSDQRQPGGRFGNAAVREVGATTGARFQESESNI